MLNKILLFTAVLTLFAACGGGGKFISSEENFVGMTFGETITPEGAIPLAEMVDQLKTKDTLYTKVQGKVASVCKKKGCWVNIANDAGDEVFVKFKDYGFFLPLNCEGINVVMEGFATVEETSVDELRHYAEDAGKTAEEIEAIVSPEREMKFMASGAIMVE